MLFADLADWILKFFLKEIRGGESLFNWYIEKKKLFFIWNKENTEINTLLFVISYDHSANVLKVCSGECFGIFAHTCDWTMIQKSAGVEVWYISSICAMCFWNMRYYNAASTMLWLWQLGLFAIEIMMIIRNHHHRPLQYLPGSTSDPVPSDLHRCHRFSET